MVKNKGSTSGRKQQQMISKYPEVVQNHHHNRDTVNSRNEIHQVSIDLEETRQPKYGPIGYFHTSL